MSIYAWMSIVDVILKLIIAYAIIYYRGDKLILFVNLSLGVNFILSLFYSLYSRYLFKEVRYKLYVNKGLLREMTAFSGWNILNNSSWSLCTSGINMLVNTFFGVVFNAARGVAGTVNGAVQTLVSNFTTAFVPQITKSYAAQDYNYCYSIVNRGIRFTWFLMYIFIVPVCIEAKTLLHLWLVEVPDMSVLFLRFTMFESLTLASGQALLTLIQANGNIKYYTIASSLYTGLLFPTVWIAFKLHCPVWITYPLFIFIFGTLNIIKFWVLSKYTSYDWRSYIKNVLKPCLRISILSFIFPILISLVWEESLLRFFVLGIFSFLNTVIIIFFLGLDVNEKKFIVDKLKSFKSFTRKIAIK